MRKSLEELNELVKFAAQEQGLVLEHAHIQLIATMLRTVRHYHSDDTIKGAILGYRAGYSAGLVAQLRD